MNAKPCVLIDTSAWILALRPDGPQPARQAVAHALAEGTAAITGIVQLELLSGAKTQREFRELQEDLNALTQLPTTDETWEAACRLAYALRRKGVTVPATDVLVMTVAKAAGCTLLHADHHFDLMARHGLGLSADNLQSLI